MSENPAPDRIMELGLGFWGSKALLSAVEFGAAGCIPTQLRAPQARMLSSGGTRMLVA